MKLTFTLTLLISSSILFASITDLIFDINKREDKWMHTFKLKGGKSFKIYFKDLSNQGKKEFNQKIYFGIDFAGEKDGLIGFRPPYLILNSDSSKSSITITTIHDDDEYHLTADGRANIDLSKHDGERINGFTLDNSPVKRYCDFYFVYPTDTSLKCTIRVENIAN